MAKKRHTPEQVINKLREAEVAITEGSTVAEAARRVGVPDHIRSDNEREFTARAVLQALFYSWELSIRSYSSR